MTEEEWKRLVTIKPCKRCGAEVRCDKEFGHVTVKYRDMFKKDSRKDYLLCPSCLRELSNWFWIDEKGGGE